MKTFAFLASLIATCSADWYTWTNPYQMPSGNQVSYDTFDAPYVVDSVQQISGTFFFSALCPHFMTITLNDPSRGSYTCTSSPCTLTWSGDSDYSYRTYIRFTSSYSSQCTVTISSVTMEYNESSVSAFGVAWLIIIIGGCVTCTIVALVIYRRRRNNVVLITTQTTGAAPLIVTGQQTAVAPQGYYPGQPAYPQQACAPAGYPQPVAYPQQPVVGQPVDAAGYPAPAAPVDAPKM
eukprot:TRINITY_DN1182_c1_g1_i1.p1 TRINITY_DN1182_c1_g1~~TRINITY_DN1182_c1_g1_i1.p1  ORF type:complete len:254 (+),score=49.36 TRINITY_DN1182_c1_g1_i1:57-764(+)